MSDLTRFPLQAMFLTKNSWQTAWGMRGNFYLCGTRDIHVRHNQKHAIKSIPACIRSIVLYVQHFQVQGEREQTIIVFSVVCGLFDTSYVSVWTKFTIYFPAIVTDKQLNGFLGTTFTQYFHLIDMLSHITGLAIHPPKIA